MLAYQSNESGSSEIYVRPFPNIDRKWKISSEGGSNPVWSRNGRELFFLDGQGYLSVAEVETGEDFVAGRRRRVLERRFWTVAGGDFDVSPDGERFLMILEEPSGASAPTEIHLVLNWLHELERLAAEAE